MLSDEHKELIEKNHNLIYKYIISKGLNCDDWYGILAETMCKVIPKYDCKRNLSKFLWACWNNAVVNEKRKNKLKLTPLEGIDNIVVSEDDFYLLENLKDYNKEFSLWCDGYTIREISEITNLSVGCVHKRIVDAKMQIKNQLEV